MTRASEILHERPLQSLFYQTHLTQCSHICKSLRTGVLDMVKALVRSQTLIETFLIAAVASNKRRESLFYYRCRSKQSMLLSVASDHTKSRMYGFLSSTNSDRYMHRTSCCTIDVISKEPNSWRLWISPLPEASKLTCYVCSPTVKRLLISSMLFTWRYVIIQCRLQDFCGLCLIG